MPFVREAKSSKNADIREWDFMRQTLEGSGKRWDALANAARAYTGTGFHSTGAGTLQQMLEGRIRELDFMRQGLERHLQEMGFMRWLWSGLIKWRGRKERLARQQPVQWPVPQQT